MYRNWLGEEQDVASPASIHLELDKVLASTGFAAADRHRRFLRFIVEESLQGRAAGIKESVLAVEVFGRGPSFDPRTDSAFAPRPATSARGWAKATPIPSSSIYPRAPTCLPSAPCPPSHGAAIVKTT